MDTKGLILVYMNYSFDPFPSFETERLVLRQIRLSDEREVFFLRSDPAVMEYLDTPIAESIADARSYIEKINNGIRANDWILWGIQAMTERKLIGSVCYWNFNPERTVAEIGYVLHPKHQGKGLMQEALTQIIIYGFGTMQLEKIVAHIHPGNKRSIKLLEKNHFMYVKESEGKVIFSLKKALLINSTP